MHQGVPDGNIIPAALDAGHSGGGFQVLFGFVGRGRLIKYIPYPVVGYLTGVGDHHRQPDQQTGRQRQLTQYGIKA
ncbi:MAG: hypothetical protein IPL05_20840 [Betaproteobacteria bacterium]|nr:hypothetical protein [Betaproteobacteria bacterium]